MKKHVKPMGGVALLLILAGILFWSTNRRQDQVTSPPSSIVPADTVVAAQVKSLTSVPPVNPLIALLETPIEFYGIVLDQENKPVPSAKVEAAVLDRVDNVTQGGSSIKTTTDADGKFTIKSKGASLVILVSKSGYAQIGKNQPLKPSSQGFDFGLDQFRPDYRPDAAAPVVFNLRKPVNPVALDKLFSRPKVPRNGSSITVDLSKTSKVTLQISCLTLEDPTQPPNAAYDWRCEITLPGGGIQEAQDEHSFLAPSDGYKDFAVIDMPKTLDEKLWHGRADKIYWLHFPDKTFGKVKFTMIAAGDHFAKIDGFRNPTPNETNLEPHLGTR